MNGYLHLLRQHCHKVFKGGGLLYSELDRVGRLEVKEVVALVAVEGVLLHNAHRHVEVGLALLLPFDGLKVLLVLQPVAEGVRNVEVGNGGEHLGQPALLYVDQHVGVGAAPRRRRVLAVAAKVLGDGLLLGAAAHHVVVELAPAAVALGVDEHDVVSAVVVAANDIGKNILKLNVDIFRL